MSSTTSASQRNKVSASIFSDIPYKRIGLLILIIILDIAAIYLMINCGNEEIKKIGYETIKLSIQLLLIVLFGGIFIQEYNRARNRKAALNEFRRDYIKDLSRIYSDVKGVRRIIRAKCEPLINEKIEKNGQDYIPLEIYDESIDLINKAKIELEILLRELRIISEVFEETDSVINGTTKMEKYIKKIIEEYETVSKKHRKSGAIPLSELPELKSMIDKAYSESGSFRKFIDSFYETLGIIQKERIKIG